VLLQCYFFDSDIGNYHYGPGKSRNLFGTHITLVLHMLIYHELYLSAIACSVHPMKPTRIRMTHSLVMNYDSVQNPRPRERCLNSTRTNTSTFCTGSTRRMPMDTHGNSRSVSDSPPVLSLIVYVVDECPLVAPSCIQTTSETTVRSLTGCSNTARFRRVVPWVSNMALDDNQVPRPS